MHNLKQSGFTLIELMILVIIIGILGTLVATTYSGIQSKNRNSERQSHIKTLQSELEVYYAQNSKYPTLADLNNTAWRTANMKELKASDLKDPQWSKAAQACTLKGVAALTGSPAQKCYAYQVTTSDGSACDNIKADCAQYTLTAMLEGGEKFVKSSLN